MSTQAEFDSEVKRLEQLVQKKCGKEIQIHLSFITKPDVNAWVIGNVGKSNKKCVKAVLLANADKVSPTVRPAVLALADTL